MTLHNHNRMNLPPPRTFRELLITRCLARNMCKVCRSFCIIKILQKAADSENQYPLQANRADGWRNNNQDLLQAENGEAPFPESDRRVKKNSSALYGSRHHLKNTERQTERITAAVSNRKPPVSVSRQGVASKSQYIHNRMQSVSSKSQ